MKVSKINGKLFSDSSFILSHGFMSPSAPVENAYHVMSEVRYECHAGFVMKGGADSLKCHATGCWMPNELPTCVRYEVGENSGNEPNKGASINDVLTIFDFLPTPPPTIRN